MLLKTTLGRCLVRLLLAAAVSQARADNTPDLGQWRAWEARKAIISAIEISPQAIFDPNKPEENNWIAHTANRLHVNTREAGIRNALLFKEGDPFQVRVIQDSERILRALSFVKDARILPTEDAQGHLKIQVWSRDAWTLGLSLSIQETGGQESSSYGIKDQNFLGTGKTLGFNVSKDVLRSNTQLAYEDPQLLGSRWQMKALYSELSDGFERQLILQRPFETLSAPWGVDLEGDKRSLTLILLDNTQFVYSTPFKSDSLKAGLSHRLTHGQDDAWRAGLGFRLEDRHYGGWIVDTPDPSLAPPGLEDWRQRGLGLKLDYQQEIFRRFQNLRGMDIPEEYNLGWTGSLGWGFDSRGLGSTRPGSFQTLQLAKNWSSSPDNLALLQCKVETMTGAVAEENPKASASFSGYQSIGHSNLVAGYASCAWIHQPNPEDILYLGGADGFRGYPNFVRPGDGRWLVSAEDRFLTDYRWKNILRLGYMVFVDAGALHQLNDQGWTRVYPDAGVGLRLGDLKSSLARVVTVSLGVPLNRQPGMAHWQLGVVTTFPF